MEATKYFNRFLADIFVKIFQIVFAMMVVGMFLRDKFNVYIFTIGLIISIACLVVALVLYYDSIKREE